MAQVQILALAHFYREGSRGMSGGAPKNDKIWGIAKIQGTLVNFWGRREGALRFKTNIDGVRPVIDLLQSKVDKGYEELGPIGQARLCPTLSSTLASQYFSALRAGRVNTAH